MNRGIGDQHRPPPAERDRNAHQMMIGLRIDGIRQRLQDDIVISRRAGNEGVGIAARHHAGGEIVPVLIDKALTIALAYKYAEGNPTDIEGALAGVESALETAAKERDRGKLPSNLG